MTNGGDTSDNGTVSATLTQSEVWHSKFYEPLVVFLDGMQAARDLDDFISENIRRLQDVEGVFVEEALRTYPDIAEKIHREAASIIHNSTHESMSKADSAPNEEAREVIWNEHLDRIRAELLILTGDPSFYQRYAVVWNRTQSRPDKSRVLRSSLLMSIVSDFEVLVSALIRAQINLRPDILKSDDQKYSMQDIEAFATLADFKDSVAEKMADTMLRGGFDDWMDWFQRRHKVAVPGVTDCPEELVEIFQRRHLLVHNGGVVNSIYLSKLPSLKSPPKVGEKLRVPRPYLTSATEDLTIAGVKLTFSVLLKLFTDADTKKAVDSHVTRVTYDLLNARRYLAVKEINEWHLSFVQSESSRLVAMVNIWTAKKLANGADEIAAEVEAWDTSTLAGRYRLVRLALLDQNEEALTLGADLIARKELTSSEWQGWPVLEGVRSYATASGSTPLAGQEPDLLPDSHGHADETQPPRA